MIEGNDQSSFMRYCFLDLDDVELESHLSDRHGNRVETEKALANILVRLKEPEGNVEKSHSL
jgi:hypothetical protein